MLRRKFVPIHDSTRLYWNGGPDEYSAPILSAAIAFAPFMVSLQRFVTLASLPPFFCLSGNHDGDRQ